MLALGRRENETTYLYTADGRISITIRDIRGGQAKLAIDAPPGVNVVRAEIDDSGECTDDESLIL